MPAHDRVMTATVLIVQAARVANVVAILFLAGVFVLSFAVEPRLTTQLTAKYGTGTDVSAILYFLRAIALLALPFGYAVERLLRALRAILASVQQGEPLTLIAARLGVDFATWQPSFTGWFAVLVAFVLVRVFAAGADMREDLLGTV